MNNFDLRQLTRMINKLMARVGESSKNVSSVEDRRISSSAQAVTTLEEDIAMLSHLVHALDATVKHIEKVGGSDV
jgi:hypothetical protein